MLTRPSFLALMIAPSAASNCSRATAPTGRPRWPGSRSLMNHAFSAKRQASRKKGTPRRRQTSRAARRFSRLTGWPPAALLVMVHRTRGTRAPSAASSASSPARSMLPLNGCRLVGSAASGIERSTARAPVRSMLARVVSKWALLGTTLPAPPATSKSTRSLARPWWVGSGSSKPVTSRTASRSRSKLSAPA